MQEKQNGALGVVIASKDNGQGGEKKRFWRINKEMLPIKLHFILFIGGMGAVLPFQSVLGINKFHLTASNLAAAYTTQQFLFILFKPGIGYLADYFNRLKATIVGLTVLQAFFCFFMIVIPAVHIGDISNSYISPLDKPLELSMCQLCRHYQEFNLTSSNLPFDEGVIEQGLNCLKNSQNETENYAIHCPEENGSNMHSLGISYKLTYKKCDSVLGSDITEKAKTVKNYIFISLSLNNSKNTHIICDHPKSENFSHTAVTFKAMKDNCYSIPKFETVAQETLLQFVHATNVSCDKFSDNSHVTDEHDSSLSASNFKTYQFWVFSLCLISSCTCISSIFTMSDTACYESVSKTGADYGQQRTWGAVSWGLICPFAGFLNDYTDSYIASWCVMVLLCSLQIWNLSKMNLIKPDFSQNMRKDLATIFGSMEFVAFETGVFMNGVFTGLIWFYLTWFITTIGGNKLIIGFAHTIQCFLGEVPLMFFSGWMIKKFGHFNLVSLALFAHGVRFLIYSYLYNPWWILPVEILHGFTFGSFYSAMTSYGKLNSKPGTEATTQSVLCTTYEGLGAGVGCVISGICFDQFGSHTTFFYAAFLSIAATGINILSTLFIRCRKGGLDITETVNTKSERY